MDFDCFGLRCILFVYGLIYCLTVPDQVEGGCAEFGKCCPGRNSKCNSTLADRGDQCYCDEFCTKSKDCCSDYEYFCGRQDCILTYWSYWSECSTRCGKGIQERKREVHVPASSGGKPCDRTAQRRTCYDTGPHCQKKEVAMILPTYYKPHRNVPNIYADETEEKTLKPSYCIRYYLTYISPFCQYDTPWHMMKKNDEICVECADVAMNTEGECKGAYTRTTGRWRGIATHYCYGSWKSVSELEENCECGYKHGLDFIFV